MGTGLLEFDVEPTRVVVPFSSLFTPPGRQRYAIGVFATHSGVQTAVATLCSLGCDVLVVSDQARIKTTVTPTQDERLRFHHIDSSAAGAFFAMLCERVPYVVLGSSAGPESGGAVHRGANSRPETQRLFDKMSRHLERGAVAVTVRAPDAEHQLQASRILLAARCAILLTHGVSLSA